MPLYRHPPDTDRFIRGMQSTQVIKTGDRALRRNAEQIALQTSGEIGLHYCGIEPEAIRMNRKPLPVSRSNNLHASTKTEETFGASARNSLEYDYSNHLDNSQQPATSARSNGDKSSRFGDRDDGLMSNRSANNMNQSKLDDSAYFNSSGNKFLDTIKTLDKSFDRRAKRNLFLASLPPETGYKDMRYATTSNNYSSMQSKSWTLQLRKDKNDT